MTKLRIRDYEPEDFLNIEVSEREMEARKEMPLVRWALFKKIAGPAYTVVDPEGQIVGCGGVHNLWPGVGEVWMVLSPLAKKYPYIWMATKKLLSGMAQGYVRLQAVVDSEYLEAMRFSERLGFRLEGQMLRYGPHGENSVLYALVKEN